MITDENVQATPVDPTEQALSKLVITASADAVFGEPVVNGNTTVIPCSEVVLGMGMGSGGGRVDENGNQTGSGSGGGGGARGRPVAAIIITQDGVRVEPIFRPHKNCAGIAHNWGIHSVVDRPTFPYETFQPSTVNLQD